MRRTQCSPCLLLTLTILGGIVMTGSSALAQEKLLHNFGSKVNDGGSPSPLISDAAGNLFGTSNTGGASNFGTVFELSPAAKGGWFERILFNFSGTGTGMRPTAALTMDSAGNLYGTTRLGGAFDHGVAFELKHWPRGGWSQKVLFSFDAAGDEESPFGIICDAAGNLYGTSSGGFQGVGAVFKLSPGSGGEWKETVLHSFNFTDGAGPIGTLIFDSAGNLYGTTSDGGAYGGGTAFELSLIAGGSWTETILHNFGNGTDGAQSVAGLTFDASGNLFGTTKIGGTHHLGTVFELSPATNATWTETVLDNFGSIGNGTGPRDSVASLVLDAAGNVFGTTLDGGAFGGGTVFELKPAINGGWTESTLHSFGHNTDGVSPSANLIINSSGNLFGTTDRGGLYGRGTVFEIAP